MAMHSGILLSMASGQPMFAQIIDQVKRLVACGDWPSGSEIPSIRNLAAGLKVSVITVKRAYAELESEGIIYTQQGKASIVSPNVPDLDLRLKEDDLNQLLRKTVEAALSLGLSPGQLQDSLKRVLGDYDL